MSKTNPTESVRRELVQQINEEPSERQKLEAKYGQVWNTSEMQNDFQALGFMAPFIFVQRRADGVKGTLLFQHSPRFYWGFQPE